MLENKQKKIKKKSLCKRKKREIGDRHEVGGENEQGGKPAHTKESIIIIPIVQPSPQARIPNFQLNFFTNFFSFFLFHVNFKLKGFWISH